jgi:AmmeMemoRadiSam system protein B
MVDSLKLDPTFVAPKVRTPACAGRFYPADPTELLQKVKGLLASAKTDGPAPKAIIAPHAGYDYSGPVAASAYAPLAVARDTIKRVVLIGPAHHAEFAGLATSSAHAFSTPLGTVLVDKDAIAQLRLLPQVKVFDQAHEPEHCLEVQLPFLQTVLDEFALVPLLVGEAADEEIAEVLAALWDGPETCFVVSSDLSHYLEYQTAREIDQSTSQMIEGLRGECLDAELACGYRPIRGLLHLARRRGLRPSNVDLRNSGDTAGPRERVVGYGAFVFVELPVA